jgi:hypothetical protein
VLPKPGLPFENREHGLVLPDVYEYHIIPTSLIRCAWQCLRGPFMN